MCSTPSACPFYYSCSLMLAQSVCMCALRVPGVHVKERERVTTCLTTSWCVGHVCAFSVNPLKKKSSPRKGVCAHMHTNMHTKAQLHTPAWTHTQTEREIKKVRERLPMRQMRSERSHIKQPNLSCFAFIAPVYFHNALKPLLRREGDMERRGERWGG